MYDRREKTEAHAEYLAGCSTGVSVQFVAHGGYGRWMGLAALSICDLLMVSIMLT